MTINVCFTGHRPHKLGGYDWNNNKNKAILNEIFLQVKDLIVNNPNSDFHFYFGGALGIDQMAFYVVNRICSAYPSIKEKVTMEIAVPFKKQHILWNDNDVKRYNEQLSKADIITYVDELDGYKTEVPIGEFSDTKLKNRNKYMVDNSDILIGFWNGNKRSGTFNCINYADKCGIKKILIDPDKF